MSSHVKEKLQSGLLADIAQLLPDRSRLNLALTSKASFDDEYSRLIKRNCERNHDLIAGDILNFETSDGSCALFHAIEYSDARLFEWCFAAADLGDFEKSDFKTLDRRDVEDDDEDPNLRLIEQIYFLIEKCVAAGSVSCLDYLCENSPAVLAAIWRNWFAWRESALLYGHLHMRECFTRHESDQSEKRAAATRHREAVEDFAEITEAYEGHPPRAIREVRALNERAIDYYDGKKESEEIWKPHLKLHEISSAGSFRLAFGEATNNKDETDLQRDVIKSLHKACNDPFRSGALVEAIVQLGGLDVNFVDRSRPFRHDLPSNHSSTIMTDLMCPLDRAVSGLNFKAVYALLRLGANIGGARAVKIIPANEPQIPSPLWRVFDQQIRPVCHCFWGKAHLERRADYSFHAADFAFVRTPHKASAFVGCLCDYAGAETGQDKADTIWLRQANAFCSRASRLTNMLLSEGVEIGHDLCEKGNESSHLPVFQRLSPLHPVHRLLVLFKDILFELSDQGKPYAKDYRVTDRVVMRDLRACVPELATACKLLVAKDPVLKEEHVSEEDGPWYLLDLLGFRNQDGRYFDPTGSNMIVVLDDIRGFEAQACDSFEREWDELSMQERTRRGRDHRRRRLQRKSAVDDLNNLGLDSDDYRSMMSHTILIIHH
ncbi:hypothetical protein F5Y18DRAFT_424720 [Xylariaceae sp. FL1019]|nr:hypothetical protein F5Y18DRAFT_424720 [Xylariaceae sp. FL1019]